MTYRPGVWTALGDPTRLAIMERLAERPLAVVDLAREMPVSRPAVSQHLKVLKEAGLVIDQPVGNRRVYRVDPEGLAALRAHIDRFWEKALGAYKATVESEEDRVSEQTAETTVRRSITVEAPIDKAFRVFTEDFGRFKPPEHNLLGVEIAETVFEPRVGGHLYDRGVDGSECRWARILAYDPPNRVVISWDIGPTWQIESDPSRTSEVEVRFIADDGDTTRVELEHRNLDRHGDGWESVRDGIDAADGWPLYLQRYAAVVEKA